MDVNIAVQTVTLIALGFHMVIQENQNISLITKFCPVDLLLLYGSKRCNKLNYLRLVYFGGLLTGSPSTL